MKLAEILAGLLIACLTIPFMLLGGIIGLFELPRYLKMKSK